MYYIFYLYLVCTKSMNKIPRFNKDQNLNQVDRVGLHRF